MARYKKRSRFENLIEKGSIVEIKLIPSFKLIDKTPVDTGRKLNVHKTLNLRPVSTDWVMIIYLKSLELHAEERRNSHED